MNDRCSEMVPEVGLAASTAGELINQKFHTDSFHCGHVINVILYHLQFFTGDIEGWRIFGVCRYQKIPTLPLKHLN